MGKHFPTLYEIISGPPPLHLQVLSCSIQSNDCNTFVLLKGNHHIGITRGRLGDTKANLQPFYRVIFDTISALSSKALAVGSRKVSGSPTDWELQWLFTPFLSLSRNRYLHRHWLEIQQNGTATQNKALVWSCFFSSCFICCSLQFNLSTFYFSSLFRNEFLFNYYGSYQTKETL